MTDGAPRLLPDHAIRAYLGRLRMAASTTDRKTSRLDQIETELLAATARAKRTTTPADATGAPHAQAPRRGATALLVQSETGETEAIPLTTVEAEALLPHPDDIAELHQLFLDDIAAATLELQTMASAWLELGNRMDRIRRISTVLSRSDTGGAGQCQACDREVSGAPNDRLRSGYDPACHRAWIRAGRPDRSTFRAMRRRSA